MTNPKIALFLFATLAIQQGHALAQPTIYDKLQELSSAIYGNIASSMTKFATTRKTVGEFLNNTFEAADAQAGIALNHYGARVYAEILAAENHGFDQAEICDNSVSSPMTYAWEEYKAHVGSCKDRISHELHTYDGGIDNHTQILFGYQNDIHACNANEACLESLGRRIVASTIRTPLTIYTSAMEVDNYLFSMQTNVTVCASEAMEKLRENLDLITFAFQICLGRYIDGITIK